METQLLRWSCCSRERQEGPVLKAPMREIQELEEHGVFFMPFPRGLSQDFSLRCTKDRKVTIGVTVLAVVLLLTVAVIVLAAKKCPSCPAPARPGCLEREIGFGNKCFYFLEEEVDWEGSQHSCLSHGAHLATIDTREELHFLQRCVSFTEYWVGLRREGSGPWKWFNGSLFNALFDIQGNGHCAYTNSHRISSDRCSETKFSICSHLQRQPSEVQKNP